jgi:hypothetical protein
VVLHRGELIGYLGSTGQSLLTFLPETEPDLSRVAANLLAALGGLAEHGEVVYLTGVDGAHPGESPLANAFVETGFVPSAKGYLLRAKR